MRKREREERTKYIRERRKREEKGGEREGREEKESARRARLGEGKDTHTGEGWEKGKRGTGENGVEGSSGNITYVALLSRFSSKIPPIVACYRRLHRAQKYIFIVLTLLSRGAPRRLSHFPHARSCDINGKR